MSQKLAWWTGSVGEEGLAVGRALNCSTEGVHFRGEAKRTHAVDIVARHAV
jgi:hypothetical protein